MSQSKDFEFDLLGAHTPPVAAILRDLKREAAKGRVRFTDNGLMIVGAEEFKAGGVFTAEIRRHELVQRAIEEGDPEKERWMREYVRRIGDVHSHRGYFREDARSNRNLLPTLGRDFVNDVLVGASSKIATWYQGPFKSDATPAADWDSNWAGATSGPDATELANADYDETNRQAATFGSVSSAGVIATSAATRFTLATGASGITLYGSTLNEVATVAYNSTDKVLLAATRFATAKSGLGAADIIDITYQLTCTST